MKIRAFKQALLSSLIVVGALAGCVSQQIGGPTAPRGAMDAGVLTVASGRSYSVYPQELAYSGTGTYRWPDGREYSGQFESGLPTGIGSFTWPNGERYRGTWQSGRRHGHGEFTRPDGSRYVGDFDSGLRQGDGVEQSDEGLYRGQWQNDLPNGQGEFHGSDGAAYEGQWVDGRRQGQGSYTDKSGNHYEGEWFDDVPDGFGMMTNANGSGYEGEWRSAVQQGYGRGVTEAGVIYEGVWVGGKRQGFGIAWRPDGSRYEGDWHDGRRQGQGRESFADGSFHDGAWEADRPLGPGTRRDRTGIEISGVWNNDLQSAGLIRLPTGAEYAGRLLTKRNTVVDPGLLAWLEARALDNDPYAHFFLGTAYTDFSSPAPDRFKATGHFRNAAKAGIADGQFRLALLLLEKSPAEAIEWLAQAAAAGQAQANTLLGDYYLQGRWVDADPQKAIDYFRAGSDAGDMSARTKLARMLATTDQPSLRDGDTALALIRPLALMQGGWQHFETLAAAYAAVGDYARAVAAQGRAIEQASLLLGADSAEVVAMKRRLNQYQTGTP